MNNPHTLGPAPAGRTRKTRFRRAAAQYHTAVIALTLAAASIIGTASATDYYVTTQYGFETWLDSLNLEPGDRIFLHGDTTVTGTLNLDWWDSGTDDQGNLVAPIIVSSYGGGRATIVAGDGPAIFARNNGGIEISDLNLVGSGVTLYAQSPNGYLNFKNGNVSITASTSGTYQGYAVIYDRNNTKDQNDR